MYNRFETAPARLNIRVIGALSEINEDEGKLVMWGQPRDVRTHP